MHYRSTRVSGLVFGAIMAALVVVFALVPVLGLFSPIPLILAYIKYGPRVALLTAVVSVGFTIVFTGPMPAFSLIAFGVLPGLVFGYGFRHGFRPLSIGLLAVAAFFLGMAASYAVSRVVLFDGSDPVAGALASETGRVQVQQVIQKAEGQLALLPNASESEKKMVDMYRQWLNGFRENPVAATWAVLPLGLFFIGAVTSWVTYLLCRLILPRFGHEIPVPTPFGEYRLPVWLVWVYALVALSITFVSTGPTIAGSHWSVQVAINVMGPMTWIFALAGIAVAYGYLRQKEVPPLMAGIFSMVGLMVGGLGLQIYMMLAIVDSIVDFRGLGHGLFIQPKSTP